MENDEAVECRASCFQMEKKQERMNPSRPSLIEMPVVAQSNNQLLGPENRYEKIQILQN